MRSLVHEPRVIAGIALMLVATVLGGLLLQGASQRVPVWQVGRDVAAGTVLTAADVHVGTAAPGAEQAYLGSGEAVVGRVLARDLTAGEMLPRAALADPGLPRQLVAVPIDRVRLVPGVRHGARVDVWWTPGEQEPTRRIAEAVLVDGVVDGSMGGSATVVLALDPVTVRALIAGTRAGVLDLSLHGGRP